MHLLLATFTLSLASFGQANRTVENTQILGTWLSPKKEIKIKIFKKDNALYGKIIWIKQGSTYSKYLVDAKNPSPSLRQRPLIGLTILNHFTFDARGMYWGKGCIYHPKHGKSFKGRMRLQNAHTLKITGYWGVFRDSGLWTKSS